MDNIIILPPVTVNACLNKYLLYFNFMQSRIEKHGVRMENMSNVGNIENMEKMEKKRSKGEKKAYFC